MKSLGISLLLFITLVAPVVTTYILLKLHQIEVRIEIKQQLLSGIPDNELYKLTCTEEIRHKVKWNAQDEFEYLGQKYDVVKTSVKNNVKTYWCIADYKEAVLEKHVTEVYHQGANDDTKGSKSKIRLFKFLESLYFSEYNYHIPYYALEAEKCYTLMQALYKSAFLNQHYPPPKIKNA